MNEGSRHWPRVLKERERYSILSKKQVSDWCRETTQHLEEVKRANNTFGDVICVHLNV